MPGGVMYKAAFAKAGSFVVLSSSRVWTPNFGVTGVVSRGLTLVMSPRDNRANCYAISTLE